MPMKRLLPDKTYVMAHRDYMADPDMTLEAVADRLGVAATTVRRQWMRLKLPRRPRGTITKLTDDQARAAHASYLKGETVDSICKRLHISSTTLYVTWHGLGLEKKTNTGRKPGTQPYQDIPRRRKVRKLQRPTWQEVLHFVDLTEPQPVRGGYTVELHVNGKRLRTFRGCTPVEALDKGQRRVRQLVAAVSEDGRGKIAIVGGD